MTASPTTDVEVDELHAELVAHVGMASGPTVLARDPVNQPMIRHWCDAMGDTNPVYTDAQAAAATVHGGVVAPPTMLQAWTMSGLGERVTIGDEPDHSAGMRELLDAAGYTSVVATNCDQSYARYLRPGDELRVTSTIDEVSERKQTGLGEGYFLTTRMEYRDQHDELVATMRFRILKFRPRAQEG